MRPCIYLQPARGAGPRKAHFHKWGSEAMEANQGENSVMWTVAIIEFDDGQVQAVEPNNIKFTDILPTLDINNPPQGGSGVPS